MAKLKVDRTSIGFHDAYVAAPSQKAALAAWGTDKPLFARGAAEVVDDPELAAEPLAYPGKVVKRLRGSAAEQVAALPPDKPMRPAKASAPEPKARPKRAAASKPKPSRAGLDAAERAIDEAEASYRTQISDLEQRERALRDERRALDQSHAQHVARLDRERQAAERKYRAELARWSG